MKKLSVLLALLVLATPSFSQQSLLYPSPVGIVLSVGSWLHDRSNEKLYQVDVVGYGRTEEEARKEGFRVAIEYAVGQLILSEREIQNGKIHSNKTIDYSSGYVQSYNVHKKETTNGNVALTMNVVVKSSKIADRLMGDSIAKINIQHSSFSAQKAKGDEVIKTVLKDYPHRAYAISLQDTYADTSSRYPIIYVNHTIEWSATYIRSVGEAIEQTKNDVEFFDRNQHYKIQARRRDGLFNTTWTTYTKDQERYEMFKNALLDVKLKVTLKTSGGKVIRQDCLDVDHQFTSFVNSAIIIDGNYKHKKTLAVPIENLSIVDNIELAMVRSNECNYQYVAYDKQLKIK